VQGRGERICNAAVVRISCYVRFDDPSGDAGARSSVPVARDVVGVVTDLVSDTSVAVRSSIGAQNQVPDPNNPGSVDMARGCENPLSMA